MLAEELNIAGLDVMKTMKQDFEIPWTPTLVKELIWRVIQKAMYDKKSTTDLLKAEEIDAIYNVINRELSRIHKGLNVPEFPRKDYDTKEQD
jgi:hypothetical protein